MSPHLNYFHITPLRLGHLVELLLILTQFSHFLPNASLEYPQPNYVKCLFWALQAPILPSMMAANVSAYFVIISLYNPIPQYLAWGHMRHQILIKE